MEITLNGEKRQLPEGMTVSALIKHFEFASERLAVELNLQILKREQWSTVILKTGDQIEIVQFVGGGTAPAAAV
ncbi:MAG: sulfur carrier protein ThiS [Terriglobia bacterium]